MMIGGIGFIKVQPINTAYRRTLIQEQQANLTGIAAGVAGAGWLITFVSRSATRWAEKYKVVYVKATGQDNLPK